MAGITEAALLALWEAGRHQPAASRALALAAAGTGRDPDELADLPLGRRDGLLLSLRERCFGTELPGTVTCPACAEALEVSLRVPELRVDSPAVGSDSVTVRVNGAALRLRAVTTRDLLDIPVRAPDARYRLVTACLVDVAERDTALGAAELDRLADRLAELDPQADVRVTVDCPACEHRWASIFDVADYLWAEIDSYVRRLLLDVHALAGRYGWTEADVLAISPARRQFYLETAAS